MMHGTTIDKSLHLGGRTTILVAPADCIRTLQQQPYLSASMAFDDLDSNKALEAIKRHKPSIVAVERSFVLSLRGQGFLRQIKSDGTLSGCRVDIVGIRKTPRHRFDDRVEVLVHGDPVMLLDVSKSGAQVLSQGKLKPMQRIRVALNDGDRPLTGIVVWSQFELPKEGPIYRAGIEFMSAAAGDLTAFILRMSREPGADGSQ